MKFMVKERPVGGVEAADLGWLMPTWRYDRDQWPYSRDKREGLRLNSREEAQRLADRHRGQVVEVEE